MPYLDKPSRAWNIIQELKSLGGFREFDFDEHTSAEIKRKLKPEQLEGFTLVRANGDSFNISHHANWSAPQDKIHLSAAGNNPELGSSHPAPSYKWSSTNTRLTDYDIAGMMAAKRTELEAYWELAREKRAEEEQRFRTVCAMADQIAKAGNGTARHEIAYKYGETGARCYSNDSTWRIERMYYPTSNIELTVNVTLDEAIAIVTMLTARRQPKASTP